MRTVKTPAPVWLYLAVVPLIAGAALAGAGQWPAAIALFIVGGGWYVVGITWFARRIRQLREREGLTTRDVVEIDYAPWMRRAARRYAWLLSLSVGLAMLVAVVVVVVAVIAR